MVNAPFDPVPFWYNPTNPNDPNNPNNQTIAITVFVYLPKLTPKQCKAAKPLLQREEESGTTVAAWKSGMIFGDKTTEAFSSYAGALAYTDTAKSLVKVDWFTTLRLTTLIPGPQAPAYMLGKVLWSVWRFANNQFAEPESQLPITNALPYTDPVERDTTNLAVEGAGIRTLFPPEYMKANRPQ